MDSIVAQINIDMIGRGRAEDIPGGGPDYLAVVGSYNDSKDLGELVAAVNEKEAKPLALDYKFDSTVAWSGYNNIYGRSDHFNYALQGVPIAFFFTGLHGDYHQRTDEPQYIDYPHYARITNYIKDVVVAVADGPRPRLNGTHPARPPKETPAERAPRDSARKRPAAGKKRTP
jgi:Zn-dependent M28 family amino/carboxypeptidase